jgi:hypothetical protein
MPGSSPGMTSGFGAHNAASKQRGDDSGDSIIKQPKPSLRATRSNPSCSKVSVDCFVAALAMTKTHTAAFPRHTAPESCQQRPPQKPEGVGNAGCQAHPQPRVLSSGWMHTSIHSEVAKTSGIPTQWFTAYSALSPAIGLFCHRRPWSNLHELDASVEASGPHGFAVRVSAVRYQHITSTASRPASVTTASRPSGGTRRR